MFYSKSVWSSCFYQCYSKGSLIFSLTVLIDVVAHFALPINSRFNSKRAYLLSMTTKTQLISENHWKFMLPPYVKPTANLSIYFASNLIAM